MASKQSLLVLAAVAACLLLLPAASVATDVDYCSRGKKYPVKVSGVQIVPDPVQPGKPATFKISASTDKIIQKGKLQTLPSFTPPGSYTITMKIVGDDNEELSCISFGFSIGFVASS
ncbi:hypothetical protein PVAP13_2KG065100 [Panicum virgatum]|uniref:MD-2-related lipid-recognition domain-containing protein n=1 Tax=Panicum virgatum TaxID=38727 RepID=A0A8T0VY06_PANVG|nr:hypothetical protein PVAP13_2KG065100 [Panicum virgatum]